MFRFADPAYLILLLIVPGMVWWYWRGRSRASAKIIYSDIRLLKNVKPSLKQRLRPALFVLRLLAVTLIILALARPQSSHKEEEITTEGIDIVLSLDVSGSMRSLDFEPKDRLGAAKDVIRDFIAGRPHDRIGLVVFAAKAFTQCPLTLDHQVLTGFLDEVQVGLIDDGTAIGLGLATAVARLRHSTSPSKTVILLTDGVNNVPTLEPETAAELAESLGVRVYTVAIGREGLVPYPVDDPFFGRTTRQLETKIDLELLQKIAGATGGRMFRASDPRSLEEIFSAIDQLETARYKTTISTWYRQLMAWFAAPALLLLVLERFLAAGWLRPLP